MLEKCTEDRFKEISQNRIIIVAGAGNFGKKFALEMESNNQAQIIFCDNDKSKQENGILIGEVRRAVYSLDAIKDYSPDKLVIVIASTYYNELYCQINSIVQDDVPIFIYPFIKTREEQLENQVRQCLSDYYYHNHFDLSKRKEYVETEYEKMKRNGQMVLPYLPVYITTRCTLNCDKCNNLMPYFRETKCASDFSLQKTEDSLKSILRCVQEITFCELVGGEPFLYRDLKEILKFVGEQKKIRQVIIVTNGTVIPDEEVLQLLKKYNVLVRISDYGLFEKIAKLVVVLEKHEINVRILQDMRWNDPGNIEPRRRSSNELFFQYNKCIFSMRCKYLTEGRLYTCARIASLFLLGKYEGEEDVLDIDESLTEEKLKVFYLHDTGRGCNYCDLCTVSGGFEIPAAVQRGEMQIKHSNYTIIRNDYLKRLKEK